MLRKYVVLAVVAGMAMSSAFAQTVLVQGDPATSPVPSTDVFEGDDVRLHFVPAAGSEPQPATCLFEIEQGGQGAPTGMLERLDMAQTIGTVRTYKADHAGTYYFHLRNCAFADGAPADTYSVAGVAVHGAQTDAQCGSADGSSLTAPPVTADEQCRVGQYEPIDLSGADGTFDWRCASTDGGNDAYCSASSVNLQPQCGTANGTTRSSAPSGAEACMLGSLRMIDATADDGTFDWECGTSAGVAACTADKTPIPVQTGATFTGARRSEGLRRIDRLSWSWPYAEECQASGDWSGSVPTSGTREIAYLLFAGKRTYTMMCTNSSYAYTMQVVLQ